MELRRRKICRWTTDTLDRTQLIELVQRCEQLGYSALWYPEALRYKSFGLGSFLLAHSKEIIIASGIANIYARDATATKQGQHTLGQLSGGNSCLAWAYPIRCWSKICAAINTAALWQLCDPTLMPWKRRRRTFLLSRNHHRLCWRL